MVHNIVLSIFFDQQYLWKESIDLIDLLHEDNYQGKAAMRTTCFGWDWPLVSPIQLGCRVL